MPRYDNSMTSSRLIVYEAKRHFCSKIMNNEFLEMIKCHGMSLDD